MEIGNVLNPAGTLVTAIFIYVLNEYNARRKVKIEKLERIYMLCQKIYDGHERQINTAIHYLPIHFDKYLEKRFHPGEEMSELKMLVRSYFPQFEGQLDEMSKPHEALKLKFREINRKIADFQGYGAPSMLVPQDKWKGELSDLSATSYELKAAVSKELIDITSFIKILPVFGIIVFGIIISSIYCFIYK